MPTDSSPPTARVLEVLDLVARRAGHPPRAADIARELGLSKATSHAIIRTLIDRGWLERSPVEQRLGLGPGLALVTTAFAEQRSATRRSLRAAVGLAAATGWSASVVELVEHTMFVSTVAPGEATTLGAQRVEYGAPFGTLFAVWGTNEERLEWLRRGRLTEAAIASYGAHLDRARADGFLVERMSPVLEHLTSLIGAIEGRRFPDAVRQLADALLEEVTRTALRPDGVNDSQPVTSIAAPVPDADGRVATALAVHPLQEMPHDAIRRVASMVCQAARTASPPARAEQRRGAPASR